MKIGLTIFDAALTGHSPLYGYSRTLFAKVAFLIEPLKLDGFHPLDVVLLLAVLEVHLVGP